MAFNPWDNTMPAFLIVHSKLTDANAFQHYVEAAGPSLERYQGTYLLGGSVSDVLGAPMIKIARLFFSSPAPKQQKTGIKVTSTKALNRYASTQVRLILCW